MKHIVTISREAENDLTEIFSWYEDKRKGLGHDFLLQVEAGLRLIEQHPRAFREEYRSVRKHLIKRFPYKIIYLVEQEKVIVLGILHGKRSSELIKKRRDNL